MKLSLTDKVRIDNSKYWNDEVMPKIYANFVKVLKRSPRDIRKLTSSKLSMVTFLLSSRYFFYIPSFTMILTSLSVKMSLSKSPIFFPNIKRMPCHHAHNELIIWILDSLVISKLNAKLIFLNILNPLAVLLERLVEFQALDSEPP